MTESARALVVYEDKNRAKRLRTTIGCVGCEVDVAPFDPAAITHAAKGYGIVLFRIRRPAWRLLEVLRAWRDDAPETTLEVVGGRTSEANRLAALEAGVNAYLTEPVTADELTAHVRSALRRFRAQAVSVSQLSFGHAAADLKEHVVRAGDEQVHLTQTECGILEILAAHPNQTVRCNDLVKILWGSDPRKGFHSLRRFVRQLRQKLEPDPANPQYLVTDPSNGYQLRIPSLSSPSPAPSSVRRHFVQYGEPQRGGQSWPQGGLDPLEAGPRAEGLPHQSPQIDR